MQITEGAARRMQDVIEAEGRTQTDAANRMGSAQPDVWRIPRGRFREYSVERLMRFLTAPGPVASPSLTGSNQPGTLPIPGSGLGLRSESARA